MLNPATARRDGVQDVIADRLQPGRLAFNGGRFFEAHELWEAVWLDLEGDHRTFVQGLIQIAAGLHHLQRGRSRPAARLIARGVEKLSRGIPAPDSGHHPALRVDALLHDAARLLAELETPGKRTPDAGALKL
jgi:predicted metal-dependent hydrolase